MSRNVAIARTVAIGFWFIALAGACAAHSVALIAVNVIGGALTMTLLSD